MTNQGDLHLEASGDREIVMTRTFAAPPALVFEAYTTPEYLKRWLLGPPGWILAVCDVDLRVDGKFRWEWKRETNGEVMGMGGVYKEVSRPGKLVNTERFDMAWYPGECVLTTLFQDAGGQTKFKCTMRYETTEGRDMVLRSEMKKGLVFSYDRLDGVLTELRKKL